jgi:hypothetical protein
MLRDNQIQFRGGLDIVTPPALKKAGVVLFGSNYEPDLTGYRRSDGYERFDGQPAPSETVIHSVSFTSGSSAFAFGQTVTGVTSGATGIVAEAPTLDSGSYGAGDAAGDLLLYNLSGAFVSGESLQVSAVTVATTSSASLTYATTVDAVEISAVRAAMEARRSSISAVPGSGPIRGIATFNGDIYAWRDNVGGSEGKMYKATSSGWQVQSFGSIMTFKEGAVSFKEGDTITGAVSSATATVDRVVLRTGAWDGSGAGYVILSNITGTFQVDEQITSVNGIAVAAGLPSQITLQPGGYYRWIEHNFYAGIDKRRLYFVNGENRAMEWDGTVLTPIRTGIGSDLDKPIHIAAHEMYLVIAYRGGHIVFSGNGKPLNVVAVEGAFEYALGEEITGLMSPSKDVLVVLGKTTIAYLVGSRSENIATKYLTEASGAIENTAQMTDQPTFMDDTGIRNMSAAQTYGDWQIGTITRMIEPLIRSHRKAGLEIIGSIRKRDRDQYRIYYADGTGYAIYFGSGGAPEIMPLTVGFTPAYVVNGEDADGVEIALAGSDDGMVYSLDVGTSADGDPLVSYLRLAHINLGAPKMEKRFHSCEIEVEAVGISATISVYGDFSYSDPRQPLKPEEVIEASGGGGYWDIDNWDAFRWDAKSENALIADLNGIGTNVSLVFRCGETYEQPHTLTLMTLLSSPRRKRR